MSIFQTLFGGNPAPAAPAQPAQAQQNPGTPGNIPVNAATTLASTVTPGTAPNGTVPATTDITGGTTKSGLDQFADLFNTDPNKQAAQGQPLFNVSHEQVLANARKQDFMAQVSPESLQKMAAGGVEGVQEMFKVMQEMSQNAYAQSTFTATKLIEGGLEKGKFANMDEVNNTIRSNAVASTLRESNPLFSHAATKPILENLQKSLIEKYPTATPSEISGMANQYLTEFVNAARAPEVEAANTKRAQASKSEDWSTFLN